MCIWEMAQTVSNNYTITAVAEKGYDMQDTISRGNSGVTVTVQAGASVGDIV